MERVESSSNISTINDETGKKYKKYMIKGKPISCILH